MWINILCSSVFLCLILWTLLLLWIDKKEKSIDTTLATFEKQITETSVPVIDTNEVDEQYQSFWDSLNEVNSDIVGWLVVPGAGINDPVVWLEDDNSSYLYTDIMGNWSLSGTFFIDGRANLSSENIVIHGHNLGHLSGGAFSELQNYLDEAFYLENTIIQYAAEGETLKDYYIFAVVPYSGEDIATSNNYLTFDFNSNEEYEEWLLKVQSVSIYTSDFVVDSSKQTLTLSTCDDGHEDGRTVLFAQEVN